MYGKTYLVGVFVLIIFSCHTPPRILRMPPTAFNGQQGHNGIKSDKICLIIYIIFWCD